MEADDVQSSAQHATTEHKDSSEWLWPYYLVTAIYLVFGAVVLNGRWTEIGSFFSAPADGSKQLALNSIGDVLAGFFAPLAFLWLFVATQLQRRELRFQRIELADTREVLRKQQLELERSAKESNDQTLIMRRTLEASQSREIYEAFGLDLYFHARKCLLYRQNFIMICEPSDHSMTTKLNINILNLPSGFSVSQNDPSSVDDLFERYLTHVDNLVGDLRGRGIDPETNNKSALLSGIKDTVDFVASMKATRDATDNELIKGRFDSLRLVDLAIKLKALAELPDTRMNANLR